MIKGFPYYICKTDQLDFIKYKDFYVRVIDIEDGEEIVKAIIPKDKLVFARIFGTDLCEIYSSIDIGQDNFRVEFVWS